VPPGYFFFVGFCFDRCAVRDEAGYYYCCASMAVNHVMQHGRGARTRVRI